MAKRNKRSGVRSTTNIVVPRTIVRAALRKNIVVPKSNFKPIQLASARATLSLREGLRAKQAIRGRSTRPIPPGAIISSLKKLIPSKTYRSELTPCAKRSIRVRVLFATKKTGAGAPQHKKHYIRTENSKVSC